MIVSSSGSQQQWVIRIDAVRGMLSQLMQMGLAAAAKPDWLGAGARVHFENLHTIVMPGMLLLTGCRKPDRAYRDFLPAS